MRTHAKNHSLDEWYKSLCCRCKCGKKITAGAVDQGSIPSRVKPMTLKLVFTASLLDAQHYRNNAENKPASLLVVPQGKIHRGIPPILEWKTDVVTPKRDCLSALNACDRRVHLQLNKRITTLKKVIGVTTCISI